MKTRYLLLVLMMFTLLKVKSQELRHSQGNKGLDFGYGYTKAGGAYNLGYVNYLKRNMILKVNLNYEKGNIDDLKTKTIMFNPEFDYTFEIVPPTWFINLEAGLLVGKEDYSNENFLESKGSILYGGTYGLEMEIYLNNNIAFLITYQQIYALGSEISPHRYQLGGGIRLILQ